MDWQAAFNVIFGVVMLLIGAALSMLSSTVASLRREDGVLHQRVTELALSLPDIYARRDDMREIRDTLVRIEKKLDNKQDKVLVTS